MCSSYIRLRSGIKLVRNYRYFGDEEISSQQVMRKWLQTTGLLEFTNASQQTMLISYSFGGGSEEVWAVGNASLIYFEDVCTSDLGQWRS